MKIRTQKIICAAVACAAALVIVEAAFRRGMTAPYMTLFAVSQGVVIVAMIITIRSLNRRQRKENERGKQK